MAFFPYEPSRGIAHWRHALDHTFPEDLHPLFRERWIGPTIDIHETDKEVVATCDLPGLASKEDVDVHVDDNVLTIKGTIRREEMFQEHQIHHRERFVGSFHRSVTLPAAVDETKTTAVYKNGVLEIHMPKRQGNAQRRIDIDFH